MSDWYCRISEKKEIGPVSSAKLLTLIRSGEVTSETWVRKGDSRWVRACEVNGLWQAAALPTVLFSCPYCKAPIEKPPTRCSRCERTIEKCVGKIANNNRQSELGWKNVSSESSRPKPPPLAD